MEKRTKKMVLTGLMCAVICVSAPFAVPIPFSPVPITMTTLILYLTIFLLTAKQALAACLIYLTVGMAGLPVFSGFTGGIGKLAGPTGGYLVGYLGLIWIGAWLFKKLPKHFVCRIIALTAGTAVCYLFGTLWLCLQMNVSFLTGLTVAVLPYLPLDVLKIGVASAAAPKISVAIKRMTD